MLKSIKTGSEEDRGRMSMRNNRGRRRKRNNTHGVGVERERESLRNRIERGQDRKKERECTKQTAAEHRREASDATL